MIIIKFYYVERLYGNMGKAGEEFLFSTYQ